jgi:hypothetical protein
VARYGYLFLAETIGIPIVSDKETIPIPIVTIGAPIVTTGIPIVTTGIPIVSVH